MKTFIRNIIPFIVILHIAMSCGNTQQDTMNNKKEGKM